MCQPYLQVKRLRERSLHDDYVGAVPLVGTHDAVGAPVRPVQVRVEHGQRERVTQRRVIAQHLQVGDW